MGLGVGLNVLADLLVHDSEGVEWMRGQLRTVDAVLRDNSATTFTEPEVALPLSRRGCIGFSYSFVHFLRRAYALGAQGLTVTPIDSLSPQDDEVVMDESSMLDSHLLCHSDCEGFYVPVFLRDPVFDDRVPGGMLGSSHGLLKELAIVAAAIGVRLSPAAKPTRQQSPTQTTNQPSSGVHGLTVAPPAKRRTTSDNVANAGDRPEPVSSPSDASTALVTAQMWFGSREPSAAMILLEEERERLARSQEGDDYWREQLVWFALWEAAEISVEYGTMIVFQ